MTFDFEIMRHWLKGLPCSDLRIVRARLITFDRLRYSENYDELYNFISELGGKIEGA